MRFIETEGTPGAGDGCRVSVWGDKNALGIDSTDGYTTL